MRYIIGVDLGGTQLRAGLATPDGQVLHEIRVATLANDGPAAVIGQIVGLVAQVQDYLPAGGALAGIGIGSPGPIDPFQGIVFNQPNMLGWKDVPLREILEAQTGLPVELGNDANAAALGEWLYGGGKGTRNMVYVTISTGIGGGVICDNRLLLGHKGAATEVGHHIIDWQTRQSWEDLASGPGLASAAAAAMRSDPSTLLHTITTAETVT
ncbi:MAG: ROK family protein, partial [Roseiflexaceae bacterium]|nr:ROK family protein [Roseiflexaceae bacterium]